MEILGETFARDRLDDARGKVGLDWVSFHDFPHFRATQWVMRGVDLRSVRELLGHADIHTTMRYAHFSPDHAAQSVTRPTRPNSKNLPLEPKPQAKNRQLGFGTK